MHWIFHVDPKAGDGSIKLVTGCAEGLVVDVLSWLDGSADVTYDTRRVTCPRCLASPHFRVAHLKLEELGKVIGEKAARRPCPWCDQPIDAGGHFCNVAGQFKAVTA